MKNDIIYLITESRQQNKNGFYQNSYIRREVFAEMKSATRSEVYTADRAGIKAKRIAVVNEDDYQIAVTRSVNPDLSYEAMTIDLNGEEESGTVSRQTVMEPEYVEYDSVRYKIERTYLPSGSTDRELTLSMVE